MFIILTSFCHTADMQCGINPALILSNFEFIWRRLRWIVEVLIALIYRLQGRNDIEFGK